MIRSIRMLVTVGATVILPVCQASAQTVTFTSLPQGTITHFMVSVISKMLLEKTDLKVRVAPMRGTGAQVAAIERGQAEFMTIDVTQAAAALNGLEEWKGRNIKGLRAVAKLVSFPIAIMVKDDSPYKTIADLKGKRLPGGFRAFRQGHFLIQAQLATAGLSYKDVKQVLAPGLIRSWDDFKAGKTDATSLAPTAPKAKELDAALGGVRLLTIPYNAKTVAAVKSVRQDFYLKKYTPAPFFTGLKEPGYLLTFDLAVATGANVPDEVVTKVVKALYENKEMLGKGHAILRGFFPAQMAKQFSVLKYHKAAEKFLKAKGVWPKS